MPGIRAGVRRPGAAGFGLPGQPEARTGTLLRPALLLLLRNYEGPAASQTSAKPANRPVCSPREADEDPTTAGRSPLSATPTKATYARRRRAAAPSAGRPLTANALPGQEQKTSKLACSPVIT